MFTVKVNDFHSKVLKELLGWSETKRIWKSFPGSRVGEAAIRCVTHVQLAPR